MFVHLALVLAAGIYLPATLVAWFQAVAGCSDRRMTMAALADITKGGRKAEAHRPWPRFTVGIDGLASRRRRAGRGARHAARPLGRQASQCISRCSRSRRPPSPSSPLSAPTASFPPSARRLPAGHSPRTRHSRPVRPEAGRRRRHAAVARSRLLGRVAAARRQQEEPQSTTGLTPSCPWKARICTRSRSARCMPASSSPAISASPPMARRWCGSKQRLGYVHKGIDGLMTGADLDKRRQACRPHLGRQHGRLCARFRAAPSRRRFEVEVPERAIWLRALMAELERLANHFGDIGAICNDASFAIMHAALRHPARARAARGGRLFRPSPDDGPHRPGRRRRRSRAEARSAALRALDRDDPRRASPSWSRSTTTPPRCRTAPSTTGYLSPTLARAVRRRRLCRPRLGPRLRRAQGARLCALRPARIRGAGARRRRRQCARLDPHPRGRAELAADRADRGSACRTGRSRDTSSAAGGAGEGMALVEAFRGDVLVVGAARRRRQDRALPSARCVLVPVAAARGCDRRQHRRRLPALQQIVQLLLFGPRSLEGAMRRLVFKSMLSRPVTEAAPAPDDAGARRACGQSRSRARSAGSAAASPSARSMPARAMAASWKSTR